MNKEVAKGFSIGVFAPIIAFLIYVGFYLEIELNTAIDIINRAGTLPHHISLSVFLTNTVLFFMQLKMYKEEVAKGILGATILYAVLVMILKLV
tara:strand:- start:197 stop:478 length:282 start_codon:yes stop_codon:yes gene_type:complete